MDGTLIVFEGIDGAGKTTQLSELCSKLFSLGKEAVCSKEPTSGPWGRKIRESATNGRMSLDDELHAFSQDRKQHVQELIRPTLERGGIVVLDRYYFSTIAYQGERGADVNSVKRDMEELAPRPDCVILLDVDTALSQYRISHTRGDTPNAFESAERLSRCREIFNQLAETEDYILKLDGAESIEMLREKIWLYLLNGCLKKHFCAKPYDCDVFFCAFRMTNSCEWANLMSETKAGVKV